MARSAADTYIASWKARNVAEQNTERYVEVPTAENATKTSSTMATALLGAIVGFGIGVLIIYLRRRSLNGLRASTSTPGTGLNEFRAREGQPSGVHDRSTRTTRATS